VVNQELRLRLSFATPYGPDPAQVEDEDLDQAEEEELDPDTLRRLQIVQTAKQSLGRHLAFP
jgi:hypothetical protein